MVATASNHAAITFSRSIMRMPLARVVSLVVLCGTMVGCATMQRREGDGRAEALVICAPSDLSITEGSARVAIEESSRSAAGLRDTSMRTMDVYRRPVVRLAYDRPHTLTLTANGQTKTVRVEPQRRNSWVWANIITSGPIGLLVDSQSGAWNQFDALDAGYPFTNTHCTAAASN